MKKTALTLIICSLSLCLFSQSATWTKDDRNNLFDDCMAYLGKYKNLSNEQQESVALCYLDEVTKKYTKVDFQAKIDIEVKRIKDATILQCAKNIGVDLTVPAKVEPVVAPTPVKVDPPTSELTVKQMLIGRWKTDDNAIIEFKSDGTYVKKFLTRFLTVNYGYIVDDIQTGDWFLDENEKLTIRVNWKEDIGRRKVKIQNYTNTTVFKFVTFSPDFIKYENEIPGYVPIQANKMN